MPRSLPYLALRVYPSCSVTLCCSLPRRQNHLGQGKSVIRAPTVEERLLIVDAVRWLGLEPVGADEAQLLELFVRTSDGD